MTREARSRDDVDRYWDALALTGRRPEAESPVPDRETADLIDRLWMKSAPPDADAARERVWQHVQAHARETPTGDALSNMALGGQEPEIWSPNDRYSSPRRLDHDDAWWEAVAGERATVTGAPRLPAIVAPASPSLNGRSDRTLRASAPQHAGVRGHRPLAPLLTAALVLLTLLGSLLALRSPLLPWRLEEQLAPIPAIDDPPGMVTLMDAFVTEWPVADPLLWASLRRQTFAPGAEEAFGVDDGAGTGAGLDLFTVESGQLTVESDGPMVLWRGSDDQAEEPRVLPAGSSIVLSAGDRLFVPPGAPFRRRNDAATPAVILGFQITQREVLLHAEGVANVRLIPDKVLNNAWPAPAEIAVRRLQLLPGQRIPLQDLRGLQMAYVEAGALDLMGARRLGDLAPVSWNSIPAGQGMAHFETTTELANSGPNPVTVLVVIIDPSVSHD